MKFHFHNISILLLIVLSTSCGKDKLDEALFGTWAVTRVEGQQFINGNPGIKLADNNPTGTVRFDDNGWGEQNYSYSLFGTVYPHTGKFRWTATADEILIKQVNEPDLVWRRNLNQPDKQIATYTIIVSSTQTIDYTLTMEK